ELDLAALSELLDEELPEEAEFTEAPAPIVTDPPRNETNDAVNSHDDLERELREMQEKMDRLREQLNKRNASSSVCLPENKQGDAATKSTPSTGVPNGAKKARANAPLKLLEDDIFSKGKTVPGVVKVPTVGKSVVHSGDTDSSDDEKRYPTESALTKGGKTIKRNLEARTFSSGAPRKPTTTWNSKRTGVSLDHAGESCALTDPYSGIRIINPLVSSTAMEARMASRKMVKMSLVSTFAQSKKIEDDWVTIGVLVNKSPPKTSKNGKPFSIWKLTDLHDCENLVSIFLFGEVHEKHWKTSVGSVVGFLNPSVMPNKDSYNGRSEVCLSIDHPGKVMLMGTSKDFGTCKGTFRNGQPCTMVVNTYTCPYCVYHVKAEYRKMSSKRTELQASYSGVAPQGIRQKILQKSQVMYGGQLYINPSIQTTKALKGKDKLTLGSLKVARQAEEIEKATRLSAASAIKLQHLSTQENHAINEIAAKSDFLGQALCKPGAGSRNFLRHVVKGKTSVESGPGPSREVVYITAKDLLRTQQQKLKGLSGGAAQPQKTNPVLGRGLGNDRVVDLGAAPVSGMKPLTASDIAKIKAIQKVRATGPLVAKDPNAVKQDVTSPEAQARIRRKLNESSGSDHGKDEESGSPKAKNSRLGPAMSKDEMEKLLRQKSSHAHQLDDLETEKQMQYFSVLEKKEQLEEKMLSVKEIQCDVVSCKICKYTAHQASDLCKKESHPLKHHKAIKRFFKCKSCSHRTTTFGRVPAQSCRKCNGSNFERTSMGKPKEGPKLPEEKLLIRGEEIKYINK
ncbi:unnamed protein product, partial [Ixodes hexagonus]